MIRPTAYVWTERGGISIGIEDRHPQYGPVRALIASILLDPRQWEVSRFHSYYDGPHCAWQFGPFQLYSSWWWCEKCMPSDFGTGEKKK